MGSTLRMEPTLKNNNNSWIKPYRDCNINTLVFDVHMQNVVVPQMILMRAKPGNHCSRASEKLGFHLPISQYKHFSFFSYFSRRVEAIK